MLQSLRFLVLAVVLMITGLPHLATSGYAAPGVDSAGQVAAQDAPTPIQFEFRYDGGTEEFYRAIEAAAGVWSNHLTSSVPVRVDVTFSSLGATLTNRNFVPPGGNVATVFYPPNNQLETFVVGSDGAVYVIWKAQNENWQPPVALTSIGFAQPGAPIAAVYYPVNEQLELFVGGTDGAVNVIWKAQNGAWNAPVALTGPGSIPPGGHLAAVYYPPNDQLEVFYSGVDGTITGLWKAQNGNWSPFWLTSPGFAPAGAPIAAAWYPLNEQLEFFISDSNGAIAGFWKAQNGEWNAPFWLTGTGFAPPGAGLSLVYYPPNEQLELFVADTNGALQVLWKAQNGAWNTPFALSANGVISPGSETRAAFYPLGNQLEVLYIGNDGSWQVVWKADNGTWNMPVGISTAWAAPAGAPVALAYYPPNEQLEALVIGVDGDVTLAWKVQNGTWQAPAAKLASASGDSIDGGDSTFTPSPLQEAIEGRNLNGDDADIRVTFNTNFDWYTGLDGRVPSDQYDVVSVVMHEIGHGLGFSASTCRGGSSGCDATANTDAAFTENGRKEVPYTTFLEDASGTRIDSYDLSQPGAGATLLTTLTSGQVFWGGPAGMAANGGNKPVINAPAIWSPGSSISHLDEATYPAVDLNELMTPQAGRGQSMQQPGAVTLGILADLGWQVRAFPPPSPQPSSTWSVYQPLNEQLEVLTVDGSGALTVRWKENNGAWNAPVGITAGGFAPAGAPVATVFYPPNNQLEAFVAGSDGRVYVVWKAQNGSWSDPVALTESGVLPAGSSLSATYYPLNDQLEVFFVDANGAVWVLWKANNEAWNPPAQLTPNGYADPGTPLTSVFYPPNNQLEVLFVDASGAIGVLWKAQNEAWNEPVVLTEAGIAITGTVLSGVYYPVNDQLEVLFVDRHGAVNVLWKANNEAWNAPVALTNQILAIPGSPIATVFYPQNEQLEAFFLDISGALRVLYKVRNAEWSPPIAITNSFFANPGDQVAASYYWLDTQLNVFVANSAGQVQLVWKANNSTWRDPTPLG
ncbi:MAG TPA: hypothetical protein VEW66_08490 [Thermomicrobiales bacterium]|nr:hypothetical protein [Thermomicrobiales bacterium]